jgi:succinate dehydrogenase/fumarate reductase flavoprotein subunit/NAD-dependent dihydropyrimidine dehydrogenase PreA subunit
MAYQIQQEYCTGCHQCKVNCSVNAIHFKGVKYWIDPDICIDCGTCVEHCHNGIITKIGEVPQVIKHRPVHLDCDVVILGAGGSGLIAAVRTVMLTGKKVIVLEKAREAGGNTWYAGGFRTYYSKLEREAGIPDNRDAKIRDFMIKVLWQEDHRLVNNVFQSSEKFADWLIEDCGCEQDFVIGEKPWYYGGGKGLIFTNKTGKKFKRPDPSIGPGAMGSFIVLKMLDMCNKLVIPVLTGHTAENVIKDKNGTVAGVIARDPGGITEISCKACVLATGCFSRNEKLLKKVNPELAVAGEPVHFFSIPSCTGDGIRLAEEAGADIDYYNMRALSLGPAHHPFGFASLCVAREPEVVFCNLDGKRWANEMENTMALRHVFHRQPGLVNYAIADSNIVKTIINRLIANKKDDDDGVVVFKDYQKEMDEESKLDTPTKKADSLEELAGLMNVPPDVFVSEIKRYNEFCRKGRDENFFKAPEYLIPVEKPPFYAFYGKRFQENAMGGAKIDSTTRVLDKSGNPIPGLYAVGDNTRGIQLHGDVGVDFVENNINALTWCVTSGFIAANSVYKYLESL